MEEIKKQYKKIIIVAVVITGLAVLVYLVGRQQVLKSKAGEDINSTLSVTDENGSELEYLGNGVFRSTSGRVTIQSR